MYTRNCPQCNVTISYKNKYYYNQSNKLNRVCRKCGNINANKLKWANPDVRLKMLKSKRFSGRTHSRETKAKMSADRTGDKHPMFGKSISDHTRATIIKSNKNRVYTDEYRKKLSDAGRGRKFTVLHREKIGNSVRRYKSSCYPHGPQYNKSACVIFEEINKEMGWNGRHAENGGEFLIKELGYWVDYYEPNLNIVIEFDEPRHKYKKTQDSIRQTRIVDLLNCKFYRLQEGDDWRVVIGK